VGSILQVEFHANPHGKFKEWSYSHLFLLHGQFIVNIDPLINSCLFASGTRVYRSHSLSHSLTPSTPSPAVADVLAQKADESTGLLIHWIADFDLCFPPIESIYYAFVKTGHDACMKDCFPKLSLHGHNEQSTEIILKSPDPTHSSSINNTHSLEKSQLDVFQWHGSNVGRVERMQIHVPSNPKQPKCQWPIEWLFVVHHGYSFTGADAISHRSIVHDG
jgi:hypothetical protein